MRLRLPGTIAIVLTVMCSFQAFAQNAVVSERTLDSQRLNEIGIWNIGSDKTYEVFVTSVAGTAACYSADTLDPLWENQISELALTAPVIGDFLGTGAPVLAFACASGQVYFLWPGTGEIISTVSSGLAFSVPPSVAKMADTDVLVLADDQGQLVLYVLDAQSGLPRMVHLVSSKLSSSTAFSVIGGIAQPPSCADLNGDGASEIVVSSESGVLQIVSLPPTDSAPPEKYYTRLAQQSRASTLAGLGHLSDPSQQLVMLGVDASLQMFKWQPGAAIDKAIQPFLQTPAFGQSLGHLLIGPLNEDNSPDLISTADGTVAARYLGRDFSGRETMLDISQQHLTTTATPFSPAVPTTLKNGSKAIVTIDREGTVWVSEPASSDTAVKSIATVPVPTAFTPAGDLTGNGKLSLVIWSEDTFTLSVATLPLDIASVEANGAGSGPVLTLGVNYSRNGQWGPEWAAEWKDSMSSAAAALKQASAKVVGDAQKDTPLTTDPVSMVAGMDPGDPISVEFRENHNEGKSNLMGILGGVAVLILVAAGGIWMKRRIKG